MQTKKPKISICVPVYGVEDLIEKCANSLFCQEYSNIEYIFVDDCTKDKSIDVLLDVLEKYPLKKTSVKIIKHECNKGLAGARLSGLKNATGDYIWFLDSDDYIASNAIAILLKYIQSGYDFIIFSYYNNFGNRITPISVCEFSIENVLEHKISPSIWKCIVKRDLYLNNAIFPIQGINYAEDFILTSRLALVANSPIVLRDEYLYYYNCANEKSLMNALNLGAYEQCAEAVSVVYDYYYQKHSIEKYIGSFIFLMGYHLLNLQKVGKNSPKSIELLCRIKQQSTLMYYILSSNMPYIIKWYMLIIYRRIINK